MSDTFEVARQRNLGYNNTFGSHRSVHAPYWSGAEGDYVAQARMTMPSVAAQRYFSGDEHNQFIKMRVETALQGEGRHIGDFQRFTGGDDYTPQIGRTKIMDHTQYPEMQKVSESGQQQEMIIVGLVVVGVLGLLLFIGNRD